jgi:L-ascorbate metabolism protein UlaG (beta-lactamase superfamily)
MVELQYLSHSCFLINTGNLNILIDPFIKDNPKSPVKVNDLKNIDVILVTHGHSDHLGDAIEIAERNSSKIICIFELANLIGDNAVGMNIGGTISLAKDVNVSMVTAHHSSSYKGKYAGPAVGFVISVNGLNIYHAGDTSIFYDMELIGTMYDIDVALLPIGDVYTMGPEAATYACKLIKPQIAIPMHYGTFDLLSGDPKAFKELAEIEKTKVKIMDPGDMIKL